MNPADFFMLALCLYREARGEGDAGMTAVGCVVRNRVRRRNSSFYAEIVRPLQFSSITDGGSAKRKVDRQLSLYPAALDAAWVKAQAIAKDIISGLAPDVTNGATMYYANTIPFPETWDKSKLISTGRVGNQFFFREK